MIQIFIENFTEKKLPDTDKNIRKNISLIIPKIQKIPSYEISLQIVTDSEMKKINLNARGKDYATDVLSFPIASNFPSPHKILGIIIISRDTLARQAKEIGHSQKEEFYRLLVHGILHLLGYDHEISPKEEKRMKKKEDECLALIFADS